MQTRLAPEFLDTPDGTAAEEILRKCVHCGFCTATCPTYQLLGDELDGPRGRIYLVKQVLEGAAPTRATQVHLDRCLTCRNCESTCPSGVEYGRLVEIGRRLVDERVERPVAERATRWLLREGLTSSWLAPAMRVGQALRPLLPDRLRAKVPASPDAAEAARAQRWPQRTLARKVLLPRGCVQPSMLPGIDAATARVLDAADVQAIVPPGGGCCGAIRAHNGDPAGSLDEMRRNIDAWWPWIDGVEAIVSNASGCGVLLKDYGHALAQDAAYAAKASRIAALARDLSELVPDLLPAWRARWHALLSQDVDAGQRPREVVAYHPPCTLQHGQQLRGLVETALHELDFDVRMAATEAHLCCGSAGTYSLLQPGIAHALRDRKLAALAAGEGVPVAIASANIGCISHLQSGTTTPVKHWIELIDERLDGLR
ncbi:MAG TPA: glycolate oxidase subunit GlcF [Burkholderiaceae bacterium]|nr:glycolate oxidase subunit GlcF [Burkholderiaceae bacterium]